MEWTASLKEAIRYMEANLLQEISAEDVAGRVNMSSFYLQKGFKIVTGYSLGEYIRGRRLYLAALDVLSGREKVIDLALKYGYETPESFTKAFSRFHGVSPAQLKGNTAAVHTFLPLRISVTVQGGNEMDCTIETMDSFKLIGFQKEFSEESSYREIPKFWEEYCEKFCAPNAEMSEARKTVCDCMVGEYGVCLDDLPTAGQFRYLIAGRYQGGPVPEGMTVVSFPSMQWAKFKCVGPMPGALQAVNTRVFKEWLPGNPDYEIAMGADIEWYGKGDTASPDYESAIWLPVKKREN